MIKIKLEVELVLDVQESVPPKGFKFKTGKMLEPKKGEWYLLGSVAAQAMHDFASIAFILEKERFKAEYNKWYYYVNTVGAVDCTRELEHPIDKDRWAAYNYYKTEQLAGTVARKQLNTHQEAQHD